MEELQVYNTLKNNTKEWKKDGGKIIKISPIGNGLVTGLRVGTGTGTGLAIGLRVGLRTKNTRNSAQMSTEK